ncbi:hypothetical protein [Paenibacillus senegalimassiliensis]|uniref:hypothetical protein n=1 Tax=Paenibacillus senegalimassiliensis TaxID=1737426 RepID=UPI00073EC716|nr:hypothetical protein [Paenibacillus senegalimassiliensis]
MKEIFLESTVNIERHFAKLSRQQEIKKNMQGKKIITSKYVIGELKGNFLLNTCTLHRVLFEEDTTEEALKRFGKVFYSQRQMSRALSVYSYIAENVGHNKDDLLDRLEILIEDVLEEMLVEDVDVIIDECNCIKADSKPEKTKNGYKLNLGCRQRPKPSCSIEEFYRKYNGELSRVSNNDDKNIHKLTSLLEGTVNNKASKFGRNCWNLGDVIIATEAPIKSEIYTTNKKDFAPILQDLNKRMYQET